jgi:hypothetical protein
MTYHIWHIKSVNLKECIFGQYYESLYIYICVFIYMCVCVCVANIMKVYMCWYSFRYGVNLHVPLMFFTLLNNSAKQQNLGTLPGVPLRCLS